MAVADRLPDTVWPSEPNVGGHHRTVRYLLAPTLLAVGIVALAGWLPLTGTVSLAVAGVALIGGAVSLLEALTGKCPGYAVLGIDTCALPDSTRGGAEHGSDGEVP